MKMRSDRRILSVRMRIVVVIAAVALAVSASGVQSGFTGSASASVISATRGGPSGDGNASEGAPDRVITVFDEAGQPIRPDLEAARAHRARTAVTPNELTFTFNSSPNPWSSSEVTQLQAIVRDAYPIAKVVVGPPLFPINVNIRKDPSISTAGLYNPSTNEMTVQALDTSVVVHEMLHAFRDDLVMGLSSFEEGMTRAAEMEVLSRLPDSYGSLDRNHSYTYDVYYDALNDPRIGSYQGNFWSSPVFPLLRYELAGYAWGKAFIETPGFFASFNAQLYAQALSDPNVPYSESKLVSIAAGAKPQVEQQPFASWYANQGVLDTTPPTGDFLYQRINQFTIDNFTRGADGVEVHHPDVPIAWQASIFPHQVIASGSMVTSQLGWISPDFEVLSHIPDGYNGRIELQVSAPSSSGTLTDRSFRTAADGWTEPLGVFGAVPRDVGGTLTITPLSPAGSAVTTQLVNGSFTTPTLQTARGTFRAVLVYSDGYRTERVFTKDASAYALVLPHPTVILPGQVSVVEGNAGSKVVQVPVSLSVASAKTVTASWSTQNNSAVAPGDYVSASGTVTFAPGQISKSVSVSVKGDALDEPDELFLVAFSNPTNAMVGGYYGLGFATITDDDPVPVVTPGQVSVVEGNAGSKVVQVPVSLSVASAKTVTASWSTQNNSAVAPGDYVSASGTVTFAPGQISKSVSVSVKGDALDEPDELFLVAFSNPTNAMVGGYYGLGFATITDDD